MDIKSVIGSILPIGRRAKETTQEVTDKPIKSDSTTDRDGNGQTPYQRGQGQDHKPMTEEEFTKAVETFKQLPAIKDKNLLVEVQNQDGKRVILLKEPSGKVLRRILESELSILLQSRDKDKGQILSKSA